MTHYFLLYELLNIAMQEIEWSISSDLEVSIKNSRSLISKVICDDKYREMIDLSFNIDFSKLSHANIRLYINFLNIVSDLLNRIENSMKVRFVFTVHYFNKNLLVIDIGVLLDILINAIINIMKIESILTDSEVNMSDFNLNNMLALRSLMLDLFKSINSLESAMSIFVSLNHICEVCDLTNVFDDEKIGHLLSDAIWFSRFASIEDGQNQLNDLLFFLKED